MSQVPKRFLMLLVTFYRVFLSPSLGNSCRFTPTCSHYSLQALETHGAVRGTYLTLRRLVRCNPCCPGGHDPVPPKTSSVSPAREPALRSRFNFRKKTRT